MCRLLPLPLMVLALLLPAWPVLGEEPGEAAPPPGPPADVALWRRGQQAGESVVAVRAEAGRLQQRVGAERLAERLERAAAAAPAEEAATLRALRERLLATWDRNYAALMRPWPVDPTRVCWYAMLALDSALRTPAAAGRADLASARGLLAECVEKAGGAVRVQAEANRALAAAADAAGSSLPAGGGAGQGVGR